MAEPAGYVHAGDPARVKLSQALTGSVSLNLLIQETPMVTNSVKTGLL